MIKAQRCAQIRISSFMLIGALWLFATAVQAKPFDCAHNHCGLLTRGNNPDLVVGKIDSVATPAQMRAIFRWAKQHGYWKTLPTDDQGELKFMQLVSLSVPSATGHRSVTVLMTHQEFKAAGMHLGAFVRYSPHDAAHDAISFKNPVHEAYWALVGCVAQLCAPGDGACVAHYKEGRFSHKTGHQLQLVSGKPLAHGTVIDPLTLLPVSSKASQ